MKNALWLGCCLAILAGCSADLPTGPVQTAEPAIKTLETSGEPVVINNYAVRYDGRTVAADKTTFHYTVFGTGVEPPLIYFGVELPDCAPTLHSYAPTQAVTIGVDPRTGIYGIRWDLPIEADDTEGRQFAITFPGDVAEGTVRGTVKSGYEALTGEIPGPCAGAVGSFLISGTIFTDADEDGLLGLEAGIGNVVVELLQDDEVVASVRSDFLGRYVFEVGAGAYLVRVAGSDSDPLNAAIWAACDPTRTLPFPVVVGPDAPGNDIGFAPRSEALIEDLESGDLLSDGRQVKFWKHELRMALSDANGRRFFDTPTMLGFVAAVQELALEDVFRFTPGNELREAWELLRAPSQDPLVELKRQLLTTEFNHVSGFGLLGMSRPLQAVLIAWGESVVAESEIALKAGGAPGDETIQLNTKYIEDALRLFTLINLGGGGSADE